MLNWICPECGRECSPSRRECPGCAEAARHAVSALGGISALARAVQGEASARGNEHSVAVAVLEEECGGRPEAGFAAESAGVAEAAAGAACEMAGVEAGLAEAPFASYGTEEAGQAEVEVAGATAEVGLLAPVSTSADEAAGIAAEVGLGEAPITIDGPAEVGQAAVRFAGGTVAAEVALVEEPIASDATVEVAQAEVEVIGGTAEVAEATAVCASAHEAAGIEAAAEVAEAVAEPIALAEVEIAESAEIAEVTAAEAVPAEVEVTGGTPVVAEATAVCASADEAAGIEAAAEAAEAVAEPIALAEVGIAESAEIAEDTAAGVAEAASESICETAAEVGLVEEPIAIEATGEAGGESVVSEATAADVPEAAPESIGETALIAVDAVGQLCGTAAEVGLVEEPIAIDGIVDVAQAEAGIVAETAVAEAGLVEETLATDARVEAAVASAVVAEATVADVAEAAPESICETAVITDVEDAIAVEATAEGPECAAAAVRTTPTLSDSSRLAFFEAQQIVAEDLLEVQAEQAAYSSAVGEVLALFRVAPAVMLLAPAGDVLTAPAPALVHCAPSARPWIAAIPPKNPAARRNVAAHETHLAGPSLPRELQSFREAARSPAARGFKRAGIPAWVASVVAATVLFLAAGTLIQKLTADRDPKPAAAAAPATSQTPAADAHPLGRFVEVTGLRVVVDLKHRSQLQYVVVNHSATPISDMALRIAVRSTASGSNDALFRVAAVVPYLGPFQSKEVRTDLDAQLQAAQVPDWDYLKADVQVTAR